MARSSSTTIISISKVRTFTSDFLLSFMFEGAEEVINEMKSPSQMKLSRGFVEVKSEGSVSPVELPPFSIFQISKG